MAARLPAAAAWSVPLEVWRVLGHAAWEPMVCRLTAGGRWIRTIGPCRHAVGSVMENVDNLAEPAGRLSQSTTLRGCYVPALVKGSVAWLLCLPVGQTLPLALSYRSTLFSFGEGPTVRIRFPPAESRTKLLDGPIIRPFLASSPCLARPKRSRSQAATQAALWSLHRHGVGRGKHLLPSGVRSARRHRGQAQNRSRYAADRRLQGDHARSGGYAQLSHSSRRIGGGPNRSVFPGPVTAYLMRYPLPLKRRDRVPGRHALGGRCS